LSAKNASMRVLLQDVSIGLRFTIRNILSFVLGILGVLIMAGLLTALAVVVLALAFFAMTGGLHAFMNAVMEIAFSTSATTGPLMAGTVMLVVLPLLLPVFVAGGAIFGMGREVIETNGTNAGGVIQWYRNKFVPLAAVGAVLYLLIIGPPAIVMGVLGLINGGTVSDGAFVALVVFSTVWGLVVSGMLNMAFPAVIDGQSATEAIRTSVRLARTYTDRVFSTWYAFVVIGGLLILPQMALEGSFVGGHPMYTAISVYMAVAMIILLFVILPAASIALNRVYLILTGEEDMQQEVELSPEEIDIDLVGGA